MKIADYLSLERQYTFYRKYHSNSTNQRIHIVFVPVLMISALAALSKIALPAPVDDASKLVAAIYCVYYVFLDPALGAAFAPFMLAMYAASVQFCRYVGPADTIPAALALNGISWVMQFYGHYKYEDRAPAVFDSLLQALLAGPIVVWLEAAFLFGLLGGVRARLNRSRVASKARRATAHK